MATVANQKIIRINKKKVVKNFTQIDNAALYTAINKLTQSELSLYLYLCGNANNYDLALSQAAVENAIGLSKSSYHRAIKGLEEKGYITLQQGNIYNFYEAPAADEKVEAPEAPKAAEVKEEKIEKEEKAEVVEEFEALGAASFSNELEEVVAKFNFDARSAISNLLKKGFNEQWLLLAIEKKGINYFNKFGSLGLLFTPSYQREINQALQAQLLMKNNNAKICEEIVQAMQQQNQNVIHISCSRKPDTNRRELYNLEDFA